MIVGVPKEIKPDEYRVGITPVGVEELVNAGHRVLIETQAGVGSGIDDEQYARYGAEILPGGRQVFTHAELVVKVKEPQSEELESIQPDQVIFTYFHFAADRDLAEAVARSNCVAVAYETVTDAEGRLPLLTPMSEVAGKLSVQEGAKYLEKPMMGRGILLGGVAGVEPAEVLILGGGVVGCNAAKVAAGLGARVIIMDVDINRLRYLDDVMPANVHTVHSNIHTIRAYLPSADLLIGAVLIPGAKCPVLVSCEDVKTMKSGAVIVDVGVDQGGCVETTKPTTHSDPVYVLDDVVHYGVTNMPGAVGRTSTYALTNATLPYVLQLANRGIRAAAKENPDIASGINIDRGRIVNRAVAEAFGMS